MKDMSKNACTLCKGTRIFGTCPCPWCLASGNWYVQRLNRLSERVRNQRKTLAEQQKYIASLQRQLTLAYQLIAAVEGTALHDAQRRRNAANEVLRELESFGGGK